MGTFADQTSPDDFVLKEERPRQSFDDKSETIYATFVPSVEKRWSCTSHRMVYGFKETFAGLGVSITIRRHRHMKTQITRIRWDELD